MKHSPLPASHFPPASHKSGISLIAVLMFMLAATTASIVVFRWISQENSSSGARLKTSEAYQASQAGLEAVQGWLTNKGADAGALIRVFEEQNTKQPVLLISNVGTGTTMDMLAGQVFQSSNSRQQKFEVYLTGVNTNTQPYELKFLSVGTARNGSKHSQFGIFKVEGLYKMTINISNPPSQRQVPGLYIGGGNVNYGGGVTVSSAYINGNWGGNPPKTLGEFVVTGDLTLSGSNVDLGGPVCVGKNMSIQNSCTALRNVYVGGNFTAAGGTFENLFVEGNLTQSNCDITVAKKSNVPKSGNLIVNGTITPDQGAKNFFVEGNLVLGPSARISFNGTNYVFRVEDSVWIPSATGIGGNLTNNPERRILGNKPASLMAITNWIPSGGYLSQTNQTTLFSSNANNKVNNLASSTLTKPTGADTAKTNCDEVWRKEDSCGNPYVVDDIIQTADITAMQNKPANATCGLTSPVHTHEFNPAGGTNLINALNTCYSNNKNNSNVLYNGFLVIRLKDNGNIGYDATPLLNGKFIFIYDDKTNGNQFRIPPTDANAKVLIYLKKGIGEMITPPVCNSSVNYNYFIYILEGFGQLNGFTSTCPFRGNIYMPRVNPITGQTNCGTTTTAQGNAVIEQNDALLEELLKSGIICDYGQGGGCQQGGSGSSSSSGNFTTEIRDSSYVPTVPHLKVSLQSQYANEEGISNSSRAEPAILIMPRVVYVKPGEIATKEQLARYYNILYLNGAYPTANTRPTKAQEASTYMQNNCSDAITQMASGVSGTYTCSINLKNTANCNSDLCNSKIYIVVGAVSSASTASSSSSAPLQSSSSSATPSSSSSAPPSSSSSNNNQSSSSVNNCYDPAWCGGVTWDNIKWGTNPGGSGSTNLGNGACVPVAGQNQGPSCNSKCTITPQTGLTWRSGTTYFMYFPTNTTDQNYYGVQNQGSTISKPTTSCGGTPSSSSVPSSSSAASCAYLTSWCGGKAFSTVTLGTTTRPTTVGSCVFIKDFSAINIASGGGTVLINGISCSTASQICANIANIKTPKDGGYYVYLQATGISSNNGWTVTAASSLPNCPATVSSSSSAPSSSSAAPTITCTVAKTSVTQGENIAPPTISCSSGALDKSGATFNTTTGSTPTDVNNWKNTTGSMNAYYGTSVTGNNTIQVSNVKCGGTTVSGNTNCGTINVSKPTCSGVSGTVNVGATITPTVGCGNAAKSGNPTFDGGTGWNDNGSGGGSYTSTGSKTVNLASVTCDNHLISSITGVSCGTVTVSSSSAAASSSSGGGGTSCIAYTGGKSHCNECYNAGLQNMNGKCYKVHQDRDCTTQWLNDNAADTYWWQEVSCTGGGGTPSSSSAASSSSSPGGGSGTPVTITNTDNNSGGPLTDGTYTISAIGSCTNIRFNCNWNAQNAGCSIQVNNGTTYSGGHNSSNNAITPVPATGATLKVVGTVSAIWCSGW